MNCKPPLFVYVLPAYCGYSGDAVNERQLSIAMAKKLYNWKIVVFTLVPLFKLHLFKECVREVRNNVQNIKIIGFPAPFYPFLLNLVFSLAFSLLVSSVLSLISSVKKIIYVRTSYLSLGFFLSPKRCGEKIIVKIGALVEDEALTSSFSRKMLCSLIESMDRHVISKADRVIVDSYTLYKSIVIRRKIKSAFPPLIVPAGVNVNKLKSIISHEKKQDIVVNNKRYTVGFIGTIFWWQGVDILANAVAIARARNPNIRLLIIGDGPPEERETVERICRNLSVQCEITGYLPHEEALRKLSEVDVMVIPSRRMSTRETKIPIKIIEAWALGVPVITTKHKVFLDYGIRHLQEVVYCEPEPKNVAEAILLVLSDQKLRQSLRLNGHEIAKKFDYDKIATRMISKLISNSS